MQLHILDQVFDKVSTAIRQLPSTDGMTQGDMLQLYALYKQSTEGPCIGQPRPSFFDIQGKYKQDAWIALGSMPSHVAKNSYIELALTVLQSYPDVLKDLRKEVKLFQSTSKSYKHRRALSSDASNHLDRHYEFNRDSEHEGNEDESLYYDISNPSRYKGSLSIIDEYEFERRLEPRHEDSDRESSLYGGSSNNNAEDGSQRDDVTKSFINSGYDDHSDRLLFQDDNSSIRLLHLSNHEQLEDEEDDPLHVKEPLNHSTASGTNISYVPGTSNQLSMGSNPSSSPIPPYQPQIHSSTKSQHSPIPSLIVDSIHQQPQRTSSPISMIQMLQALEQRLSNIEQQLAIHGDHGHEGNRYKNIALTTAALIAVPLFFGFVIKYCISRLSH